LFARESERRGKARRRAEGACAESKQRNSRNVDEAKKAKKSDEAAHRDVRACAGGRGTGGGRRRCVATDEERG
jgi:hypothetical protein